MAFEFRLPDIGEGLAEAEVVEWLVAVGQQVRLDEPLVQIETDKAVTDIPAPRAGVLLHQGAPAGSTVKMGELLAVIGEAGEEWAGPAIPAAIGGTDAAPIVGSLVEAEEPTATQPQALPLVRRLAVDLGVDLSTVAGSGPGGRITKEDVEASAGIAPGSPPGEERVRMSKLRRTIADRMARSWREIPHVTTFGEADATRLLSARRELAVAPAIEAFFVRAVLPALRTFPEFNASLQGEDLVLKRHYDVGVAVDSPDGLVVGVIRGADALDLSGLSDEVARLAVAIRDRTATPRDLSGATFTVSNIGAVGGGYGTPIIPYGTTAILSFGRIEERPVVRDGRPAVAPLLPLSLSYDHRVIDGALGRRFLAAVIENLEASA